MKINTISMKNLLWILPLVLLVSCNDEPAEDTTISPDSALDSLIELPETRVLDTLTGHWVKMDYLDDLQKSADPFGSQDKLLPISEVIVDEGKGTIQIVFGYNEACNGPLSRSGDSLIVKSCDGNAETNFVFEYDPFSKQLLLTVDELSLRFVRVSTQIEDAGKAVQQLLVKNKLFGTFRLQEGAKPLGSSLQFGTNGFVRGSSKYNKYKLILGYASYPAFNSVIWMYRNAQEYDAFYWELQGDSLIFSNFKEEMPDMFETAAVYLRQP